MNWFKRDVLYLKATKSLPTYIYEYIYNTALNPIQLSKSVYTQFLVKYL